MPVTVAIVGLGAAARRIHLPAFATIPAIRVVGGCDPAASPQDFPFPLFPSAEELLDKTTPDILAVGTPPDDHYDLVQAGLGAGCHVLCEKPFVDTRERASHIVEQSSVAKKWVVVNNQYRFMKTYREAKRSIGSPMFGQLLFVNAEQTFHRTQETEAGWRGRDKQRTCKEFGTHVFDLCRFFFDEDPIAVTARMPRADPPAGPDDLNLIQLDFSGDRVAQITLDRLSRGPHRYLDIRLEGSRGCIETRLGGSLELRAGIRSRTHRPYLEWDFSFGGSADLIQGNRSRRIARNPLNPFADGTARLMEAFLKALENGEAPPCHAEDNCRSLAIMLSAYDSAAQDKKIVMSY